MTVFATLVTIIDPHQGVKFATSCLGQGEIGSPDLFERLPCNRNGTACDQIGFNNYRRFV